MGTVQDFEKTFQVVVEVRKQLELLLEAPEGKTKLRRMSERKYSLRQKKTSRPHASSL
jgi:hypothetical protein